MKRALPIYLLRLLLMALLVLGPTGHMAEIASMHTAMAAVQGMAMPAHADENGSTSDDCSRIVLCSGNCVCTQNNATIERAPGLTKSMLQELPVVPALILNISRFTTPEPFPPEAPRSA